jgi:hypothetical protein
MQDVTQEVPVASAAAPTKSKKFDLAMYRSAERKEEAAAASDNFDQTLYPVRKPGSKLFFRAHPDKSFCIYGVSALEDSERNIYLLEPGFNVPEDIARFVYHVNLVACVTHKGGIFVWPFKDSTNDWSKSAMAVLRKARAEWVRLRPNLDVSCYMTEAAPPELAAVKPKWPDVTFEQILDNAFDGRIVSDANNPVVRELQGKE